MSPTQYKIAIKTVDIIVTFRVREGKLRMWFTCQKITHSFMVSAVHFGDVPAGLCAATLRGLVAAIPDLDTQLEELWLGGTVVPLTAVMLLEALDKASLNDVADCVVPLDVAKLFG